MLDFINSAFMILSSFWIVTIMATIGMKFASVYKGEKPLFIRGYIWIVNKISRSIPYRIVFHGLIVMLSTIIPLVHKIKALANH